MLVRGGFGPAVYWFNSGLWIYLTPCKHSYVQWRDNQRWPRANLESGFQAQQAGYWSRVMGRRSWSSLQDAEAQSSFC